MGSGDCQGKWQLHGGLHRWSKGHFEKSGQRWCGSYRSERCALVESVVTIRDGDVAGMRLMLDLFLVVPLLVFPHSRMAIVVVRNAAACRSTTMANMMAVVDLVGVWLAAKGGVVFRLGEGPCGDRRQ